MTTDTAELSSYFELPELTPPALEDYLNTIYASFQNHSRFDTLVSEYRTRVDQGQGDPLKLAVGYLLVGKFTAALEQFERAPENKYRHYFAAKAALGLNKLDVALEELKRAARRGWDGVEIDLRIALVHARAGDMASLEKLVKQHETDGVDRADWHYARGLLAELQNEPDTAFDAYDKALTLDPDHAEVMFRAARLYDLWGEDRQALALYHALAGQPRAHVNALLNAAVIYEDRGDYDEAARCLRRVLRAFPNHARARLFLKDVESCQEMVIDEGGTERVDARTRLLDTPLSEYELSVRARNCLKKMNIRTLGELMRLTEAELLAYKNFGETSLNEIKALLSKKGLRLGQSPEEIQVEESPVEQLPPAPRAAPVPPGQEAVLAKPVSELELSVRARRCLQRLNVQTLGELVQMSEQDLLSTRNFGVTSLNEVRARLDEHGLKLATKKSG